jgi:protein O-GlcNAc transferase
MKKVISYSLWGDHPRYWKGAIKNIEGAAKFFPGWICRFYIDDRCSEELIAPLRKYPNVEIVMANAKDAFHGTFWRFYAANDPTVDVMLSRDTDSRFSRREVRAVKQWLRSPYDFHIMRDHPYHQVEILGGMWGARNGILRSSKLDIVGKIEQWTSFSEKGCDQDFLGAMVYPLVKPYALEHSSFGLTYGGNVRSFPGWRKNNEFVGEVYDENDVRNLEYWLKVQEYGAKKEREDYYLYLKSKLRPLKLWVKRLLKM